jgi:hypothetical protein
MQDYSNSHHNLSNKVSTSSLALKLKDPITMKWVDLLIKRLQQIVEKENLSSEDAELLNAFFGIVPRTVDERDKLEFLIDKLSTR